MSEKAGYAVSMSGDGTTVAIASPDFYCSSSGCVAGYTSGNVGLVRVYTYSSGSWTLTCSFGTDVDTEYVRKSSLAMSSDGKIIAHGHWQD